MVAVVIVVVGQEEIYCCQGGIAIVHEAFVSFICSLSLNVLADLRVARVAAKDATAQQVGEEWENWLK